MADCAKCHGTKRIPLGIVPGAAPCDHCDGSGEEPFDPDRTPVTSPDARRRSSTKLEPPVPCPACNPSGHYDARADIDCKICFNVTCGGPTRYVSREVAEAYERGGAGGPRD